ncbi:12921_t:CDS:1, partial [Racocetra fulgida]
QINELVSIELEKGASEKFEYSHDLLVQLAKMKTNGERAINLPNKTARDLLMLMERKKSNLAVALDVTTKQEFLDIADKVGPYICCLK